MKKLLIAVLALSLSSSLYAACDGPYCHDDKGAVISSGLNIYGAPVATLLATNPSYTNQIVVCTDCDFRLCISTGTGIGAYVVVGSTVTAAQSTGFVAPMVCQ